MQPNKHIVFFITFAKQTITWYVTNKTIINEILPVYRRMWRPEFSQFWPFFSRFHVVRYPYIRKWLQCNEVQNHWNETEILERQKSHSSFPRHQKMRKRFWNSIRFERKENLLWRYQHHNERQFIYNRFLQYPERTLHQKIRTTGGMFTACLFHTL